jgi:hypothetical protein
MGRYRVYAEITKTIYTEVDADSQQEAEDLVETMDEAGFTKGGQVGNITITSSIKIN